MSDSQSYLSVEELQYLSLEELRARWGMVPTERQKAYRVAYDREVRNAGAVGSDDLELRVAAELLLRYRESALVPVGSRWARTPTRVQEAARNNAIPGMPDDAISSGTGKPSPRVIAIGAIAALIFGIVMMSRLLGGGSIDETMPEVTAEPTETLLVEISPTPQPLALEAQDDVITGGDSERVVAYPVNLQVELPDVADVVRVWVVQRREVRAAEWNFDPNPDVASFLNGMAVRPVIGIPWSEGNAALFEAMGEGTVFNLTMNTGAILRYEFAAKTEVQRSDTRIFRQVGPGLVLLLIGETDADGLPTNTRTLITATYPPEQELSRSGELIGVPLASMPVASPTPTPQPTAIAPELDVQMVSVTTIEGQLTTRLRIYNAGAAPVTFTPDDIWLALGYAPDPPGPRIPAEGLQPFTLLPEQAVDLTLVWYWLGEPYATICIINSKYNITLNQFVI